MAARETLIFSVDCCVLPCRLRRRTEAVGAASAAIGSLGEEREGCLSCFPRGRRRGRPGLARFAPCALPHTYGLSSLHSGLTGAKVRVIRNASELID